ncbi:MAG TPA: type II toxin-antitoxin system PemK/MazF family toxin [Pyrinomonadaceae bacterium]|nr:type II toxin-antitoxin system PemK/MazF family toxin [Pyrinomonadaceae bacterium]
MTNYKFGEIVLVPFPFTDQKGTKKRPAVIVSSSAYNLARLDLVLMAITSQIGKIVQNDEIEILEWRKAGLLKPSVVKPVFTTIEKNLILKRLGNLEDNDKENLKKLLEKILG